MTFNDPYQDFKVTHYLTLSRSLSAGTGPEVVL